MSEVFLNVVARGDNILERYLDSSGEEQVRKVEYKPSLFTPSKVDTKYKDIYGNFMSRKKFDGMKECRKSRAMYEAVHGMSYVGMENYAFAYMSDTYNDIVGNLAKVRICTVDIEVTAPEFPSPMISIWEIDALTHYDSLDDHFYAFGIDTWTKKASELSKSVLDRVTYVQCTDEKDILVRYLQHWSENPPVAISGWNSDEFDIPYIYQRILKVLGSSNVSKLSPWGVVNDKIVLDKYKKEIMEVEILGVSQLDYLKLYKKFVLEPRPTYKLDYIGEVEVNQTKLDYSEYRNLAELKEKNYQKYMDYNIMDVDLVIRIDANRNLFNLALSIAWYAKVNFEDVYSPIRTWDAIIFNSLRQSNVIIPPKRNNPKERFMGAWVKEPNNGKGGLFESIASFDLTSLYPHVIMQWNISPETIVEEFNSPDLEDWVSGKYKVVTNGLSTNPCGVRYSKDQRGIIPIEIEKVFNQRKHHKKLNGQYAQDLLKIDKEIKRRGLSA